MVLVVFKAAIVSKYRTEPAGAYLKSFHWNKVKYRVDKPLSELIDTLQKVVSPEVSQKNGLRIYRKLRALTTMSKSNITNITNSRPLLLRYKGNERMTRGTS